MSADNGIYILKTSLPQNASICGDGFEYRVAYHSAIDNVDWDDEKKEQSDDSNVRIKNAREMWKNCKVFLFEKEALAEAAEQYHSFMKDGGYLEYGISFIEIPKVF